MRDKSSEAIAKSIRYFHDDVLLQPPLILQDDSDFANLTEISNNGKLSKILWYKLPLFFVTLSSNRPNDVWKVNHRILNLKPQTVRVDPDHLNAYFASSAERVAATSPVLS